MVHTWKFLQVYARKFVASASGLLLQGMKQPGATAVWIRLTSARNAPIVLFRRLSELLLSTAWAL